MLTIRNASLNMSIHNGKKTSPLDSPNLNLLTANNGILELAESVYTFCKSKKKKKVKLMH